MGEHPIEHHTTTVRDHRVHYMTAGEGEPVVLLHGWPQTAAAWTETIADLASSYTVIAPDLRGLGFTAKAESGYDTDNIAADVHALVTHLGYDQISLVGHDWGGAAAYAYAARYRDQVKRLAIFEMVLPGFGLMEEAMVPKAGGNFLWHMGFQSVPVMPEVLISGREADYLNNLFQSYAYNPDAVRPERMDQYVRSMRHPGALHASLGFYRDYFVSAEQNREHAKVKLEMPVLAMGGEACLGELPKACLEMAAVNVEGGAIARCGHWVGEEQPGYLIARLRAFLAGKSWTADDEPAALQ
ncbi:alpha/beta fold hydrolase [Amycolatopsis pithecellobii]|uniref:Alpha/beta fold hydrolase n=1 Tax=Amycolatopsis pithecellobii TaxID=664692 RepID=A0A6N7Z5N2_9PSEU|nr:alpha/beta hydrolase [Amycolatopsis pithecellobii]MTD57633.1 alpha/beta fold hydrolase [Amycolatopsis pithecellobii]